jgi:hypothetical protein
MFSHHHSQFSHHHSRFFLMCSSAESPVQVRQGSGNGLCIKVYIKWYKSKLVIEYGRDASVIRQSGELDWRKIDLHTSMRH